MKIILTATNPRLVAAFRAICGDLEGVTIHEGPILDVACDAVISPANSFGFMDGGIDAQYVEKFGAKVQDRVRWQILQDHHGELLVGAATIVETGSTNIPFLIAAPTMRVPMALSRETINPYLAMRAVMLLVREGVFQAGRFKGQKISDHVTTIAVPGMGTGVGRVPATICARQIREAIVRHKTGPQSLPKSWAEASEEHQYLYTDAPVRLQY